MSIYKHIVNQKLKNLSANDLSLYSEQYNLKLSTNEVEKIIEVIQTNTINIFDDNERTKWIRELARITSPNTARQVNTLLMQITK